MACTGLTVSPHAPRSSVHAVVDLDYGNAVLVGIQAYLVRRLQRGGTTHLPSVTVRPHL